MRKVLTLGLFDRFFGRVLGDAPLCFPTCFSASAPVPVDFSSISFKLDQHEKVKCGKF